MRCHVWPQSMPGRAQAQTCESPEPMRGGTGQTGPGNSGFCDPLETPALYCFKNVKQNMEVAVETWNLSPSD